ncbi:MAG: primase [Gaiellaceae bacterium]|nr:primase [Gaiellaceae bacterium]MDX6468240.1 primase [Gaiellaceae bacterium]MDX6471963.1 primase [Gaiellaceae bacterium]
MARIKDASVEAVKNAAEILPLVEDYVRLRKAGGTYKGLCPFHQEKSPSFTVTPARGTYKCFGCGEYGDAIAFVAKLESVDFVGAIETLAKRFGVQIEYEESSPEADRERKRKERLGQLLERATAFYERMLWGSEQGAFARAYLESRGLGEEVCRAFRLGFAPGGDTLARGAQKEGFTRDDLLATGLGNTRGNDYFQRRLLFPLTDARGNVRGFQARKLYDDDRLQAKYVNSPESDLFKKGDLLYGLDGARQSIAKEDRAVVVEGNTDVIALRQAGFLPVVASMGTALTERQLKELQRLTKRLFLCFDSDAAGQDATLRGMELAVAQGFDVKVVPLPKGSDPADDPAIFQERLAAPVSYLVHRVRLLNDRATDKQSAFAAVKLFLNEQPDSPEHLDARQLATDLLGLPPETQATFAPARSRSRTAGVISPRLLEAGHRLERSALAGVAVHPSLNRYLETLSPEHFDLEIHRRARAHLLGEEVADAELTPLVDELYALAGMEEINDQAAEQMLLRLQERHLQRQLNDALPDHMSELQQRLAQVRIAIREFA